MIFANFNITNPIFLLRVLCDSLRLCVRKFILIVFVFLSVNAFSESEVLQLYMQRFSRADLSAKAQILENAANDRSLEPFTELFYEYALQFALDNSALLKNDHDMTRIINIALRGLQDIEGLSNVYILWNLFIEYQDTAIAPEIIIALGKLGKGNNEIINNINNFLAEKNTIFKSGESVNYAIVSACISALLELGDSSSYPVLFDILSSGYPEVITFEAQGALELIPGGLKQFLYEVIERAPPSQKFTAFRAGVLNGNLSVADRGQLAELALEQSLIAYNGTVNSAENADLQAMRYAAVITLTELRWTRANPLAIRHFYRVQADYQSDDVSKNRLIEAIDFLGAVGNSDAALILGLQLSLINSRAIRTGEFDEEITLAVVRSLGLIGDSSAFDHLLDISNLPYPENIQTAAEEAASRLRWQ